MTLTKWDIIDANVSDRSMANDLEGIGEAMTEYAKHIAKLAFDAGSEFEKAYSLYSESGVPIIAKSKEEFINNIE